MNENRGILVALVVGGLVLMAVLFMLFSHCGVGGRGGHGRTGGFRTGGSGSSSYGGYGK